MGLVHFGTNLATTDTQFREPCHKQARCHYDMAHLMSRVKKVASRNGGLLRVCWLSNRRRLPKRGL